MVSLIPMTHKSAFSGIFAWSSGSWSRPELWTSEWPQCPVEEFANLFSLCEQIVLLYGIRLCIN
jgi:hypothetical protein